MAEPARQPFTRRQIENFPVRTGGEGRGGETSPDREKRDLQAPAPAAAPPPPAPADTTTPPPVVSGQEPLIGVVDEGLELILQRLRFRGARAFLWRYRDHLEVVRYAIKAMQEGRDMGPRGGIRNPGGFIRWWVKEEVGDGDE